MQAKMDLHTHSVASGHHTTDTVTDMAREAKERGAEYLGITEHAPKMLGSCGKSYFSSLSYSDKKLFGVNILYGAELNVLSRDGKVDLEKSDCKNLVYCIASLHKEIFKPQSEEVNTRALVAACENPLVNIIGHPDDPTYEINFSLLTDAAKANGTILEFNAVGVSKNGYRGYNIYGLIEMLLLCEKKGVYISLGSDSHGKDHILDFNNIYKVLQIVNFPDELVVNYSPEKFFSLLKK